MTGVLCAYDFGHMHMLSMPFAFKMEACECPSDPKVSGFWWGCVGLKGHNLPLVGKLLDPGPVPAAGAAPQVGVRSCPVPSLPAARPL